MEQIDILRRPVITEKSMSQASVGRFTFEVAMEASKNQIRQAVEKQFKVKVVSIHTLIVKGKKKRVGKKRQQVKNSSRKKAIVTLFPGQKIDIFEGVESGKKA